VVLFIDILTKITLPIIALAALGGLLQPRLKFDVASMNRLQVYVILPAFLIHYLSTGTQPLSAVWPTAFFWAVQFMFLIPIGWLATILFRMPPSTGPVVGIATAYANVGFFGIPLVQLAFSPEYIMHQSIITSLTTILVATVGVWMLAPPAANQGLFGRLKLAFDTPMIPAVVVGLALRGFEIKLPTLVGMPIELLSRVFTPLALFTLGCQLADSPWTKISWGAVSLVMVLKLLIAPALTWMLGYYMGFSNDLIALYVVAAATPVGVLISVFCKEFDAHPELVSSSILISTILSPLFVTGWILATRMM
jgi:malate permease and related proteins